MRQIPFARPIIGNEEREAVNEVLKGPILVHGPKAHELETSFADFTKAPHAVSVSSCTAALHLCYFHLGIGAGDEVVVPAQTHNAGAHAVELTGAKPVFVDAEMETGNIDIDLIEGAITGRTKALSVVHYLGMPVDMDRIMEIARRHGLFVVEDCALAVGSYFKGIHAGLHGDAGCFSFYPVKHMTTAEGGMLITKHPDVAAAVAVKKAFGVDRTHSERKIPGSYDVTALGFNYRMSEVHAAIGIEQIKRVPEFLARRKENYDALTAGLREIEEIALFRSSRDHFQSSCYCHSIQLKGALISRRFEIIRYLNEKGIGTSVYYPRAVPHFTYYREKYGYGEDSFPTAAAISNTSIALPVGPHLDGDDMRYITTVLKEAIRREKQ
jgi:perosamine synthetase